MNAVVPVQTYAVSDLERMAKAVAASGLFGITKPDQAMALMLIAQAEGMHPATAARDYHIIQGRPAKKADAMLRDFISAGGKVEWHELGDAKADATFSHPSGGTVRIDWTLKRAADAGISTPMWKKYPRQMLRSRVVSEGVRTVCPGATSGMYVPEEVQDIVAEERPRAPQSPLDAPQEAIDAEFTPAKRKSSAQSKRDGDDAKIKAEIAACNFEQLHDWHANFDENTAHVPFSWLDSIRDMLEHRLEELNAPPNPEAEEMDAAFRGAVGPGGDGVSDFPGDARPVAAA